MAMFQDEEMNRVRASTEASGFTVVEMMIATAILLFLLGMAAMVSATTSDAADTTVSLSKLNQQCSRLLDRLSRELLPAELASLSPPPMAPLGASSLSFRKAVGINAGATVWGELCTFDLRDHPQDPADGVDNNDNGLIDERQLVLVTEVGTLNETEAILSSNIRSRFVGEQANSIDDNGNGLIDERGLCFELRNGVLIIHLCIEGRGRSGRVLTQMAQTGVRIRN